MIDKKDYRHFNPYRTDNIEIVRTTDYTSIFNGNPIYCCVMDFDESRMSKKLAKREFTTMIKNINLKNKIKKWHNDEHTSN